MRFAPLLLLLAAPLHAELLATFQTTQGNVVVVLQYDKVPQTVANFITLAQGTRARITANGAVTKAPLYVGEKFFRVVNDDSFKIAQTGSGTGTNSGGPGYSFRDEFDSTLTHKAYVLSMANSGVHTNGSQIFFTGSTSASHLNNVHTVFGLIKEGDDASKAVIDAILVAGDNATTINAVTISRTDAAAVAFDEFNQDLPECLPVPGHLAVIRGTKAEYLFKEPLKPGTILQAYRSTDLSAWSRLGEIYHGTGEPGFDDVTLDGATLPKAFYNISMVTYPDALAPASFANRTLELLQNNNETSTFVFGSTGFAGNLSNPADPANSIPFTLVRINRTPYTANLTLSAGSQGMFYITSVLDGEKDLHVVGRNRLEKVANGTSSVSYGGLTLTKPLP